MKLVDAEGIKSLMVLPQNSNNNPIKLKQKEVILIVRKEVLRRNYELLYPEQLEEDEYVYLLFTTLNQSGGYAPEQVFVRSFDEYCTEIEKRRYKANIFNGLATVVPDENGNLGSAKENQYRRQVLFFDFDRKDFPDLNDANDFTQLIKDKFPKLFIQSIYDSGHGFHFYVSVKPTEDAEQTQTLYDLNRRFAILTKADLRACSPTQIARVPTSRNLKKLDADGKPLAVNEVLHSKNYPGQVEKFHPYSIYQLERMLKEAENSDPAPQEFSTEESPPTSYKNAYANAGACFCTEQALKNGVEQGERNTFLGRIIFMLKGEGLSDSDIYDVCQDWNCRCKPPKNEKEVDDEIRRYLEKIDQYKLNGCWWVIPDNRTSAIVQKYCDVRYCPKAYKEGDEGSNEDLKVKIPSKLVSDRRLKKNGKMSLNANELLVMTVLHKYSEPRKSFTVGDLKQRMQRNYDGCWGLCMSQTTLKKILHKLQGDNYIEMTEVPGFNGAKGAFDDTILKIGRNGKDKDENCIEFYYSTAEALIAGAITEDDFRVYLCIIRNIGNKESCIEDHIGSILGKGRNNVSTSVHRLERAHCLAIIPLPNHTGNYYNRYEPMYTSQYHIEESINSSSK